MGDFRVFVIITLSATCFARDRSIPGSCADLAECSLFEAAQQSDSGSFVQIAVRTSTGLMDQAINYPSLEEQSILVINKMPRLRDRRLLPAVYLFTALLFCSLLLKWYRSYEGSQDDISSKVKEEGTTSIVRLMGNIWPNIILAGFVVGMMEPLQPYICLSFFAQTYTDLHPNRIRCDLTPEAEYCKKAVTDSVWWTSLMSVISAAVHIGLGPALGALSDAFGRKPIIIICESLKLIPSLSFALFVFFSEISLYFWYALSVFTFLPVLAVWFALITDLIIEPERRATAFGLCLLAWELSGLLGMIIGTQLSVLGTVALSVIVHIANLLYIVVLVKETLPESSRAPVKLESLAPVFGLSILARNSLMRRLCVVFTVSEFVTVGLEKIGLAYFQKHLAFDKTDNYVNCILGQVSVLAWIACLMHQIVALVGEFGLLIVAQGVGLLFNLGIYICTSTSQIFAFQGVLSGAVALIFPATAALKGSMVATSEQGHLQGAVQGVRSLASCLGPLFFGCIFNILDRNTSSSLHVESIHHSGFIFALGAILHGFTIPVIFSMPHDILQRISSGDG